MKQKKNLKHYITHIKVNRTKLVSDFEIPLDQESRKHLIITGKNGSGKTFLLREIDKIISSLNTREYSFLGRREEAVRDYVLEERRLQKRIEEAKKILDIKKKDLQIVAQDESGQDIFQKSLNFNFIWKRYEQEIAKLKERRLRIKQRIESLREKIDQLSTVKIDFSNFDTLIDQIENKDFIYIFFEARRSGGMSGDERFQNDMGRATKYRLFADYMNNLKIEYLFEKENKNHKRRREIQKWFDSFEKFLKKIFQMDDLKLIFKFLEQKMQCFIAYGNQEFNFNQLSDGYSALLMIVAELIMQMSEKGMRIFYDMQGVVLIDEVETHLHIALQKEVMPYLCELFPNIQFVVTTHSPFVLSSLGNAVVCDLEKRTIVSDGLSGSSFESLVDTYFDTNKYSNELIRKIQRFEELSNKWREAKISEEEILELNRLELFLDSIPEYQNEEVALFVEKIKKIKSKLYGERR